MIESQGIEALDLVVGQLTSSQSKTTRVLGIAGCRSGDGATFLTEALSSALAARTEEQVLEASLSDLLCCAGETHGAILDSCSMQSTPNCSRFAPARLTDREPHVTPARLRHVAAVLATRFRFLVLDCGAIGNSRALWPAAQIVDDLLLVIAAGETTKSQIAYAQRLIARSGIHLAGCILNKRTYPLPKRIYQLLA